MIDLEQFNVRLGNNTAVIQQVMKMFLEQYAEDPSFLRGPFESGDTDALFNAAHSIKGALANMCADEDAAAAAAVESVAREGKLPDEALLTALEARLADVFAQIRAELGSA